MQAGLSTKNAPSIWVVVPHFFIGTLSFIIACAMILFSTDDLLAYHISGSILAIIHLLILGWVTLIIFGALYQLIPVVMEVKLYSEKVAYATLAFMLIGLVFLISGFLGFQFQLSLNFIIGGSLIILSILLFTFNAIMSAINSKKKSISKLYIVTACIYLLLVVSMGFFVLLNFKYNFLLTAHTELLKMHAVLGLLGWFIMLVIGVASRLMPMFLIVHKTKDNLLKIAYVFLNIGIVLFIIDGFNFFKFEYLSEISVVLVVAGIVLFLFYNYDIFKKRLRKKLDIGMKLSAIGLIMFLLSLVSFVGLQLGNDYFGFAAGRMEIISGFILIYGFFTGLILGQTYKTLPFIIWLHNYQALVGRQKTPLPADLYSDKLATIHMLSFFASMLFMLAGLLLTNSIMLIIGASLMLLTSIVYAYNVFRMIFHKKQLIK